jgi:regulator of protease activity HflC (stomatin/prohibitin superfamily)
MLLSPITFLVLLLIFVFLGFKVLPEYERAVIYFRVVEPERAIVQVEDYLYATSMMAQTTLRSVLGQSQLDDLLSKRDQINADLQRVIDQQTEPWGIKVSAVEVKNVDLPVEMQRVIAKQAEAERERRSKVIHAQGEFEASQRLADAADVISRNPAALQLRYLQTLVEIAAEKNSRSGEKLNHHFPNPNRYARSLHQGVSQQVVWQLGQRADADPTSLLHNCNRAFPSSSLNHSNLSEISM